MLGEKMGTMTAKVVNKVNPANNGLPSFEEFCKNYKFL